MYCADIPISPFLLGTDAKDLATHQTSAPDARAFHTAVTDLKFNDVCSGDAKLLCDISLRHPHVVVPDCLKCQVFDSLHGLAHPYVQVSQKFIRDFYV